MNHLLSTRLFVVFPLPHTHTYMHANTHTHTRTCTQTLTHTHTRTQMRAIQQHIPLYLSHITQLLNNVPRQLVLILKTNDLLRSLEYSLKSPLYNQSYVTMSKYCLRAIGEHEMRRPGVTWAERVGWGTRTQLSLLMVRLYETWLWLKAVFL